MASVAIGCIPDIFSDAPSHPPPPPKKKKHQSLLIFFAHRIGPRPRCLGGCSCRGGETCPPEARSAADQSICGAELSAREHE